MIRAPDEDDGTRPHPLLVPPQPLLQTDDWIKARTTTKSDLLGVLLPKFGTTLEACTYKGYYIMGFYNVKNSEGVGFAMSLSDYTTYNEFYGYKDIKILATGCCRQWLERPDRKYGNGSTR